MDEQRKEAFNPRAHTKPVNGQPYLPVAWRLVWLRDDAPESRIVTELITHTDIEAVMRAEVTRIKDGEVTGSATAYGSETQQDFGDYLEKAETKAIGRALAALGYSLGHDDFDEAPQRPQNRQQAPAPKRPANAPQRPPQNPTAASPNDPANANQLAAIENLAKRKGLDGERVDAIALVAGFKKPWTNASAQAIIKALQEEPNR